MFSLMKYFSNIFGRKVDANPKQVGKFKSFVDDLILGIDFATINYTDPVTNEEWIAFELLRGRFKGIKFKFNAIGIDEVVEVTGAQMTLNYDFLENPTAFTNEQLQEDQTFVNTVFNIAHAIIVTQTERLDKAANDLRRNDLGEPDSE